jgi:CheY-like chemotaxis protein/nitrogen-specific signal transduction histidine kinase
MSTQKALAEQKRADAALTNSYAKSNFLAKMSHEIRTPISVVLGISELQLQNPNHNLQTEEAFAKSYSSGLTLLSIVNDILDLSKIESGKMSIKHEEYDVASFISDSIHLSSVYVDDKDIDFKVNINPKIPSYLIGDELRTKQVLSNILSNSFKYTTEGSIVLSLDCNLSVTNSNEVNLIITIADTGRGMTETQIESLFDEYTRFSETKDKFSQGTGLGMSITKNLLELMHGDIKVQSAINEGTKVVVTIPQGVSDTTPLGSDTIKNLENFETNTQHVISKLEFTIEPMPYGSILIVDDLDANIYVAKSMMSRYQLNIDTCQSGHEAIQAIQNGKTYDIIFMDQMMPEMSGHEATEAIRKLGYTAPIISFTANALVGQAEDVMNRGYDGFISKPIKMPHLDGILKKFIKNKHEDAHQDVINNSNLIELDDEGSEDLSYLNDPALMASIQEEFIETQKNVPNEIIDHMSENDMYSALRKAHTLKSLSQLLGMNKLQKLAREMEDMFHDEKIPSLDDIENLKIELETAIRSIS